MLDPCFAEIVRRVKEWLGDGWKEKLFADNQKVYFRKGRRMVVVEDKTSAPRLKLVEVRCKKRTLRLCYMTRPTMQLNGKCLLNTTLDEALEQLLA